MSNSQVEPGESKPHLLQVLTFWDLVIYGLVYVSPVGPWSTWGFAGALAGGSVALVFLLGAVALSFTAFSYAQMCTEVPDAGSVYAYARYAMGDTMGFLAGWMVLLDYLLLPALMYVFCGVSLSLFIPAVPSWAWVLLVAIYNLGVNWFGVKTSARFNFGTLILQFLLLACVLAAALWVMQRTHMPMFTSHAWWQPSTHIGGVFAGASLCVMAYLGFDAITTLSAEVKPEQRRLVGRAVIFCIALLGALAVINVWILSDLSRGFTFGDDLTTAVFDLLGAKVNPLFGRAVTWSSVLVVAISITPPMVTAVARVLFSMAEKGEMPRILAKLDPKYGVPRNAILASGALSISVALYFASQFDTLTSMVNFGALTAFAAVNASVIALFVVKRHSRRLGVHLVLPLLGIVTILAVITQMSKIGLAVGGSWLAVGAIVAIILRVRAAKAGSAQVQAGNARL
jgi:amino acid transporter